MKTKHNKNPNRIKLWEVLFILGTAFLVWFMIKQAIDKIPAHMNQKVPHVGHPDPDTEIQLIKTQTK